VVVLVGLTQETVHLAVQEVVERQLEQAELVHLDKVLLVEMVHLVVLEHILVVAVVVQVL
jgi:hypothetical protein